jgi:hypothetical protein
MKWLLLVLIALLIAYPWLARMRARMRARRRDRRQQCSSTINHVEAGDCHSPVCSPCLSHPRADHRGAPHEIDFQSS